MLHALRLNAIRVLMGRRLEGATLRALYQGTQVWFECTTDPAMQMNEDDRKVVAAVQRDIDVVESFWRL